MPILSSKDGVICNRKTAIPQSDLLFMFEKKNRPTAQSTLQNDKISQVVRPFRSRLKVDLYPVQIDAAIHLTSGAIAEVQTGEGKTFITGAAAAMLALQGRHVHVATTTDYLSERDFQLLRPVFCDLNLSAGCLVHDQSQAEKRRSYQSEIVYGCGAEFGFDYLQDQLRLRASDHCRSGNRFLDLIHGRQASGTTVLQRHRECVIIDEADSVMIDEAGTPLVLGAVPEVDKCEVEALRLAAELAKSLRETIDFEFNGAACVLKPSGISEVERHDPLLQTHGSNSRVVLLRSWRSYVINALRAYYRLQRDVHYVVMDGDAERKIAIIDPNTGRIHEQRSWQGGLHQAVEVKEGLPPSSVSRTAAQITRQRFLQKYQFVSGLTGTAQGNELDFKHFFELAIQEFKPHRPCQRKVMPTRYFNALELKGRFVVDQTIQMLERGRPVIVATRSIEEADCYVQLLREASLDPAVLHGVQEAEEAIVVAAAGHGGQVTVATSIAGRGTDISVDEDVCGRGGLHLISTQHYDSPRVDRQLAGRVARQGQPGSIQQVVSPFDTLFTKHAASFPLAKRIVKQIQKTCVPSLVGGLQSKALDRSVGKLQRQIEAEGFQRRLRMVQRDKIIGRIQRGVA